MSGLADIHLKVLPGTAALVRNKRLLELVAGQRVEAVRIGLEEELQRKIPARMMLA